MTVCVPFSLEVACARASPLVRLCAISGGFWLPCTFLTKHFLYLVAGLQQLQQLQQLLRFPATRDGVLWRLAWALGDATVAATRNAAGSHPRSGGPSGPRRWWANSSPHGPPPDRTGPNVSRTGSVATQSAGATTTGQQGCCATCATPRGQGQRKVPRPRRPCHLCAFGNQSLPRPPPVLGRAACHHRRQRNLSLRHQPRRSPLARTRRPKQG